MKAKLSTNYEIRTVDDQIYFIVSTMFIIKIEIINQLIVFSPNGYNDAFVMDIRHEI